jgi:hypothetical protein
MEGDGMGIKDEIEMNGCARDEVPELASIWFRILYAGLLRWFTGAML